MTERNEYVQPFFNASFISKIGKRSYKQNEAAIQETRLDLSRMQVITFSRIACHLL
jgi:hypothetical protein